MEQRSEKEHPSLNIIHPPGGKSEIIPLAPPFDQRSTKWNKEQEEWARRKAWEHHKEPFPGKGHCGDVHNTDFFKSYLPTKAIVLDLRFIQRQDERCRPWSLWSHVWFILFVSRRKGDLTKVRRCPVLLL